jgi:hypothetical protein
MCGTLSPLTKPNWEDLQMMRILVVCFLTLVVSSAAHCNEDLFGSNVDVRNLLAYQAPEAAVQKLLPAGWEIDRPAAGPAKGANFYIVLIDSTLTMDPEGKLVDGVRGFVLAIPAKNKGNNAGGPMIVGGLVPVGFAPGAYGVYTAAKVSVARKSSHDDGKVLAEELWEAQADNGAAIRVKLGFVRGTPAKAKLEQKAYSGAKPDFFRIYRIEQAADVVRSAPIKVDRTTEVSVDVAGQPLTSVLDGTEQLIAIISVPWYSRQVFLPKS